MKRLTRTLLHLYPRRWRDRYETEFAALVEDTGGPATHFADLLSEAIRLRMQSTNVRLLGISALAGLAIALTIALSSPVRYTSSAELRIEASPGSDPNIMADVQASMLDWLIHDHWRLSHKLGIPKADIAARIASGRLRITSPGPASPIAISYADENAAAARAGTSKLITLLLDEVPFTQQRLAHTGYGPNADPEHVRRFGGGSTVAVTKPPSAPETDSSRRWMLLLFGPSLGLLTGLAILWIRRHRRLTLAISAMAVLATTVLSFLPLPQTATAELAFDSPQTMQSLIGDRNALIRSLLPRSQNTGGPWFRLELQPLSPTRLRVAVRHFDGSQAGRMMSSLVTLLYQRAFDIRKATRGRYEAPKAPWVYIVHMDRGPIAAQHGVARSSLLGALLAAATALLPRFDGRRNPTPRLRTA